MVKVNVKNGTLDQKEIDAYVQYAIEANPGKLVTELDIDIDGDFANLTYHFGEYRLTVYAVSQVTLSARSTDSIMRKRLRSKTE